MEPDSKARQRSRPAHGIRRGRAGHHEAGGREDALAMGALDRLVHFDGQTEVVRRDDDFPQYRYCSCLNGPETVTPMYSACCGESLVSFAPTLSRCSAATFSSKCFGSV